MAWSQVTTDVWKAVTPIYSLSRWLGLFPWALSEGGVHTRLVTVPLLIFVLQCVTFMSASVVVLFENVITSVGLPGLFVFVHKVQLSAAYLHLGASLYVAVLRGAQLTPIYEELAAVDVSLSSVGMVFKYDLFYSYLGMLARVLFMACYFLFILIYYSPECSLAFILGRILFCVHALFIHITQLHFTVLVSVIKSHFIFITERLRSTAKSYPYQGRTWKLECLVVAHDGLCTSADHANSLFSLQNLAFANATFVYLTGNCYLITDGYIGQKAAFKNAYLPDIVFWSFFWVAELLGTVYLTKTTKDESRKFTKNLYDLLVSDGTGELSKNKILALQVDMSKEVEFTACGFFVLDYTLFHSMIAATATYLIILIQFSNTK